jgi:hypothetical protein
MMGLSATLANTFYDISPAFAGSASAYITHIITPSINKINNGWD